MDWEEMTIKAAAEIFNIEYETPEQALEYLKNSKNFILLSEGIKKELKKKGFSGTDEHLYEVFSNLLNEHQVAPAKATSKSWFFKNGNLSRENAIRLCFALELSPTAATTFLNKACSKNGFNFRNEREIIYYYCLQHNKPYSHALTLYEKYNAILSTSHFDNSVMTSIIRKEFISLPDNDDAFIKLLQSKRQEFTGFSQTSYNYYKIFKNQLIKEISNDPDYIRYETEEKTNTDQGISNARLLRSLYLGFPTKEYDRTQKEVDFVSPKESQIQVIFENIPVDWNLSEFDRKKKPVTRELLILFRFFCSFFHGSEKSTFNLFDDFFEDMNNILCECGMGMLYPRNPFDWFVLSSVDKDDPYLFFNDILELSFDETINQ